MFFVSFLVGMVIMLYRIIARKETFSYKSILSGFLLGSFNFVSTYYFIKSMSFFESSVFFPVVNVSIVVLTSLIGFFVFKEYLSHINWIGIIVVIAAILIITVA